MIEQAVQFDSVVISQVKKSKGFCNAHAVEVVGALADNTLAVHGRIIFSSLQPADRFLDRFSDLLVFQFCKIALKQRAFCYVHAA